MCHVLGSPPPLRGRWAGVAGREGGNPPCPIDSFLPSNGRVPGRFDAT
jgi:hypothetical protein